MSHRSKVLLWSKNPGRSSNVEKILSTQGITTNQIAIDTAGISFQNSGANSLVLDFNGTDTIAEEDFNSLWSAAKQENLKVIYLTEKRTKLPPFLPQSDANVQILAGPAPEQMLISRLRLMNRLDTMAEEIERRSETLEQFGIDSPYDIDTFDEGNSRVLLVGIPSKDFTEIEASIASAETQLVGAYTHQMAFEYLEGDEFDLVLYNTANDRQQMLEFLMTLRQDARYFNLPALVLGEPDEIGDSGEVYKAGATEISFKPVCEETLLGAAGDLIREHRYHRHLASIYFRTNEDSVLDDQTGLFRYGFLMDHLTKLVEHSEQTDTPMTVAFFDIMNLKAINSEFGYAAGDSLIRQVGNMISKFFRGEDLCARYSGEEFVAVMPRTSLKASTLAIKRLVSTINATQFQLVVGLPPINFHLTFGQAEYELGDTEETLVQRARQLAHHH